MAYVSHARTPEELQAEVISDLRRRLEFLDGQIRVVSRSKAEQARLSCARIELEQMLRYWLELEITRPGKVRKPKALVAAKGEELTFTNPRRANYSLRGQG